MPPTRQITKVIGNVDQTTTPELGVLTASIVMRLFVPIAVGVFANFFLQPIPAFLIGLATGLVINWLFPRFRKNYATFIQFLWFAGALGYSGIHIPFIDKTTPSGFLGIALGVALFTICAGAWFYIIRKQQYWDLSKFQGKLLGWIPIILFIVSFLVFVVGGVFYLHITTINGYGWNSGGGVIVGIILSVIFAAILAALISMGLGGGLITTVFTSRGIRETLGYDYPKPPKVVKQISKTAGRNQYPASQSRDIGLSTDTAQALSRIKTAETAHADAMLNARIKVDAARQDAMDAQANADRSHPPDY